MKTALTVGNVLCSLCSMAGGIIATLCIYRGDMPSATFFFAMAAWVKP